MLTDEQIKALSHPFDPIQHGWVSGSPYLKKSAIMERLNTIDPGWQISAPSVLFQDDGMIVLTGSLTICGVTRSALGTGTILRTKKDQKTGEVITIEGFELLKGISKAWKAAASDLLPRAANMFGIGTYLRDIPSNLKGCSQREFAEWVERLLSNRGWASNGGRDRLKALLANLNLTWPQIAPVIEPGRTLSVLADTTLTEEQFFTRCAIIAATLQAVSEPAAKAS